MAAIVSDGVRVWAADTLDRKLGRVFSAFAAMAMLAAVPLMHPGPARIVLAVGVIGAVRHAATAHQRIDVAVDDLAEVEAAVIDLRARVDRTESAATSGMRDVRTRLGVICARLDR